MLRYILIVSTFLLSTIVVFAQDQNNILFIAVDDLKPLLSNYGHDYMHTPNFDRLAKMGVTFDNAHVQQAVCGPSRASIMTGTTPDVTKVWDLHTNFRESNPSLISMPEYLIDQGYETTGVGKIYHKGSTSKGHDSKTWSIAHSIPENWDPQYGAPAFNTYHDPNTKSEMASIVASMDGKKKGNARTKVFSKLKPSTESADVSDHAYQDGVYTLEALKKLNALVDNKKPFFLAVGYQRPHLPFVAPKKYWDLYSREDITLALLQELGDNIPKVAYHNFGELRSYTDIPKEVVFGETLSTDKQRELIHGYMACISYIDAQLGILLDEYDRLGLDKNTNIVLWGDHGFHLGDHTLWCKHSNFEQATRIPLMFAGPGVSKGIHVDQPVELLDVFPTLFDLANVKIPSQAEGISLRALMDSDESTIVEKDYAISQYSRAKTIKGYSLRTKRYRYTEWHDNNYNSSLKYNNNNIVGVELYDYEVDPLESRNLAEDKTYEAEIEMLKAKLKSHLSMKAFRNSSQMKELDKTLPTVEKKNKLTKEEKKAIRKAKQKAEKARSNSSNNQNIDDHSTEVNTKNKVEKLGDVSSKKLDQTKKSKAENLGSKPNVVVIIADDLGYHDLGFYGSEIYDTPNIDRLASESLSFQYSYSSYPRCTPSRYGMITATYPVNENYGNLSQIPDESNFIKHFDNKGYQTSYVGKWHLGGEENAPKGFGFDHSYAAGTAGGTGTHFYPFNTKKSSSNPDKMIEDVTESGQEGDYLADVLTDETIDFIIKSDKSKPFFAMLAHYGVHTPIEAKAEDRDRNKLEIDKYDYGSIPEYIKEGEGRTKMRQDDADYAGMVENLDENVGRLLKKLDELGLTSNTIVVFTSDHGGLSNDGNKRQRHLATSNYPLRAGKGHLYEGGIRVPLFIKWPSKIKSHKDKSSIFLGMDLMPTLLDLAIDQSLENVDGQTYEQVMNKQKSWDDRSVYWHQEKARPYSTGDSKCTAVRSGQYKLLHFYEKGIYELYDLKHDINEEHNIAAINNEVLKELKQKLEFWKKEQLTPENLNRKKQ